jgi:hypothetical protein
MRFLKRRRDVHAVPVQPRAHRLAVIRWVYISGVAILAVWLANFAFGGLLYLQSEGLVLGEPGVVAAEFPVTVRDIMVRQGERVRKGQVAAVVSSQNVTETIARLTADIAVRESRKSELRIRRSVVNGMLALAQDRQNIASNARKELETLMAHGNLSLNQRTAAVDMEYRSSQDLEALKAEQPVLHLEHSRGQICSRYTARRLDLQRARRSPCWVSDRAFGIYFPHRRRAIGLSQPDGSRISNSLLRMRLSTLRPVRRCVAEGSNIRHSACPTHDIGIACANDG